MNQADYGEEYFKCHCGIPYHRGEPHWMRFFDEIARRIDDALAPKSVFDAGCAIGFLVESFRVRGIEAFGRDFSSYAIGQLPVGLKPYCECGSIADPITGSYDLVTCIEVLEHMPPEEALRAVENMCRAAPKVLFSSSPLDFTEATHINVQPVRYWMKLFAEHGFAPAAQFDGSFLTPWTVLFERRVSIPDEAELDAHAELVQARIDASKRSDAQGAEHGAVVEDMKSRIEGLQGELSKQRAGDAIGQTLVTQLHDKVSRLEAMGQRLSDAVANQAMAAELRKCVVALQETNTQLVMDLARSNMRLLENRSAEEALALRLARLEEKRGFFHRLKGKRRSRKKTNENIQQRSPEEEQILASGLFDSEWYRETYEDIRTGNLDPVRHYVEHGAAEGRDPNPYFSTKFYVEQHPGLAEIRVNPLVHYINIGSSAGSRPSEDFDAAWYQKTYLDIGAINPLYHYIHHGRSEGRRRFAGDRSRDVASAAIETVIMPASAEELVLFVTHAPSGKIKPHVLHYIETLKACDLSVVLIIVAEPGDAVNAETLASRVDGLFIRENGGFDFAAWAHVAQLLDLSTVRLLGLVNDSLVGPFSLEAMREIMGRVRASDAQLVGLTDNYEFRHHLQSYFLMAKDEGVPALLDFLATVRWLESKQEVILSYEVEVLDAFKARGLLAEALFPSRGSENRTTTAWVKLIEEGFPFIKMAVLQSSEPAEWRPLLVEKSYDPGLAEASLAIMGVRPGTSEGLVALNAALSAQLQDIRARYGAVVSRVAELEQELSRDRKRPMRLVHGRVKFLLYRWLAKSSPPLPAAVAEKYARRARRYDPYRSNTDGATEAGLLPEASMSSARVYRGLKAHDPQKKNVLVVSHQASATGAPILTLNVGEKLSSKYNICFLCLTGGELIQSFGKSAERVIDARLHSMDSSHYEELISRLTSEVKFEFAIVNSVESHAVLRPLHQNGVPSVVLLHEFASYTGKKSAFPEAMRWADEVVFSTYLTLDNAFENNLMDYTPRLHVIPQGKCEVPRKNESEVVQRAERALLREKLAPEQGDRKPFLVIGAGTVEIRKGVDLFIEVATRVLNSPGAEHVRFAWVGAGYAPDRDFVYSVYLRDQLKRAGIEKRVAMLPATPEIDYVYELADALLISSRLDPLPNVGIDALARGMPVFCFSKATGIADLLTEAGLADDCVAEYIDTTEMAEKILKLVRSGDRYGSVAERTKIYADKVVDFAAYLARIEALAVRARRRAENKEKDIEEIVASGHFRSDFYDAASGAGTSTRQAAADYIERLTWVCGARKPEPGFNPFIYAHLSTSGSDGASEAYADFLRRGRPAGPWLVPVLEGGEGRLAARSPIALKSALHIHAYFPDRLAEIAERLVLNQSQPDLFISVSETTAVDHVADIFERHRGRVVVRRTPNIGRDIGPLLRLFGPELIEDYDVVGHIHVKKSNQLGSSAFVAAWSDFLLENLIGGKRGGRMQDRILSCFADDERVGIIYPDDPHILGWTRNLAKAERIARRMGHAALPEMINFPIGTMFWMRSAVLKPFVELDMDWPDYPSEPLPDDGTELHALERLFGVIPPLDGWQTVVTNIRGVTR